MFEYIILGIIQGISEWLPVSSEGLIVLAKINWFHSQENIGMIIRQALFLHFGTFAAALVYFWRDIILILKSFFSYQDQNHETKKLCSFLLISTIISGFLGLALIKLLNHLSAHMAWQSKIITIFVGCLLLGTGLLELKSNKGGLRGIKDLTVSDGILLGLAQGLATLPGFSRSGLTVSILLLRKLDKAYALKLSFLMSLPIVLGGNIALNLSTFGQSIDALTGVMFAFIFGLATIHLLLKLAEVVNFGYFVLLFGVLTILSVVV